MAEALGTTVTGLSAQASSLQQQTPSNSNAGNLTFHPFTRMPLELQIEVWKVAVSELEPRHVDVRFCIWKTAEAEKYDYIADIPSLLHVNQASRIQAKRAYSLILESPFSKRVAFFDPEKDTLYFRAMPGQNTQCRTFIEKLSSGDRNLIRNIAFNTNLWAALVELNGYKWQFPIHLFGGLKTIAVLAPIGYPSLSGCDCRRDVSSSAARFITEEKLFDHFVLSCHEVMTDWNELALRRHMPQIYQRDKEQDPADMEISYQLYCPTVEAIVEEVGLDKSWAIRLELRGGGVLHSEFEDDLPNAENDFYYQPHGSVARMKNLRLNEE